MNIAVVECIKHLITYFNFEQFTFTFQNLSAQESQGRYSTVFKITYILDITKMNTTLFFHDLLHRYAIFLELQSGVLNLQVSK